MVGLIGLVLTSLVFLIPGLVLSFGLFTGTSFKKLDRLLAGVLLGLVVPPLLAFLEFLFLAAKLTPILILVNSILLILLGLVILHLRKKTSLLNMQHLTDLINRETAALEKYPMQLIVPVVLVVLVIFGFYLRFAFSWITNFFEFDPYYYTFLTEMLVRQGSIPLSSDISYFPLLKFHHEPALVQYAAGSWYLIYNFFTGLAYDKSSLILITNLYPPIVGALLSVLAYWFIKSQYNEIAGLVGAAFFAVTPSLLQKFAAGVAELQPWGIFSALFIFAAYTLALRNKDWEFTILAALATFVAILGAVQSLWPVGVMAAFFIIQAFVNYYSKHNEFKLAVTALVFSASVFFAYVFYNLYANIAPFTFPTGMLLALLSCIPAIVFFGLSKTKQLAEHARHTIVLGIIVVGGVVSLIPVLPGGESISSLISNFIDVTAAFAHVAGPLSRTIAEETPTDPAALASAFGILGPWILLLLAVLIALGAVEVIVAKGQKKLAAGFIAFVVAIMLFRVPLANFANSFGNAIGLDIISTIGNLLATNDVFAFLLIAIIASIITFIYSKEEDRNEAGLISVLAIYPVAYIGLSKVKFLVHLGVALVAGIGVLIGEFIARANFLHSFFQIGKSVEIPRKWLSGFAIALVLILFSVQTFGFQGKAPGAVNSVSFLGNSQISGDWLASMSWLVNNTSFYDPAIVANCKAKFGHDCRVISWWDYGHWTAFLGETKTVLDPGNQYEFFDQEVAYGFVDNATAFKQTMQYHNASHVLVDYQLLQKWGALNFLSGTCQKQPENFNQTVAVTCPDKRQIQDWKKGAGASEYELDHGFEQLSIQGACPFSQNMALMQSNVGLSYCASQTEIIPIDRTGLRTDLARHFEIVSLLNSTSNVNANVSYLIPISQNTFINANPDFSIVSRKSKIVDSVYTRLYVFENLPGFKLVYRSPQGEVKIFERTFDVK